MGEFGVLWDIPEWVRNLSPFAHSPVVPGPDPQYLGVAVMLVLALGLVALGIGRFARRDVVSA
jgi:ABC-2 type transport system permease protein